ncbi:MAG: Gfo/Idh/MocA family oxidoreductase [Chloroflexi bacterium]|nr:Gfo/Idh/MocA family oxidoreductase [Chloroflexota bacterium]
MAEQKLRAAVIGCGLGANHAYAYANVPEYELVGVCDINPAVFPRFYERSRLAPGSVREYLDYHDMLAKERPDVVSVATPDDYHTNPVIDASNAGVKGIFCEKPICINLKDADRMLATVTKNGTKMSVDHTRSWRNPYQSVRKLVRQGEIGPITRIVAHMGGHRSMLFRNGTHLVDAVCFFAEAEPVWVMAVHEQGFENYGTEYKGEGGKDPALDPGSTIIIEFANGVRGVVNSAKNTPAIFEFDLQGPMGRFLVSDKDGTGRAWKTDKPEGSLTEVPAPWSSGVQEFLGDNLIPAVQEMAQMIWHNAPSSSPPERAHNTLEILYGALVSHSQGGTKVQLPLPRE